MGISRRPGQHHLELMLSNSSCWIPCIPLLNLWEWPTWTVPFLFLTSLSLSPSVTCKHLSNNSLYIQAPASSFGKIQTELAFCLFGWLVYWFFYFFVVGKNVSLKYIVWHQLCDLGHTILNHLCPIAFSCVQQREWNRLHSGVSITVVVMRENLSHYVLSLEGKWPRASAHSMVRLRMRQMRNPVSVSGGGGVMSQLRSFFWACFVLGYEAIQNQQLSS